VTLKHILVVDDDPTIRLQNLLLVKSLGYRCVEAEDGQFAMILLRNVKFAAVLSDINMPHMNGLELLEAMQHEGFLSTTPVIVVSNEDAETKYKAHCLGAKICLPKPLQKEQLLAALGGILR
jgi:CheY-like chemotaxis protein